MPDDSSASPRFGSTPFEATQVDVVDGDPTTWLDSAMSDPDAPVTDDEEAQRTSRKLSGGRWAGLIAAAVIALLAVVYLVDWLSTKDDIANGTTVGGVDVGGLSPAEAVAKLQPELTALSAPLTVQSHGTTVTLDPMAAGLTADFDASVAAAGRRIRSRGSATSSAPITRTRWSELWTA